MGADFISYVVVGPYKLSRSKTVMARAKRQMTSFVELAKKLSDLEAKSEGSVNDLERVSARDALCKLVEEMPHGMEPCDVTWATSYKDNPMKLVEELLDVWHNASRDSTFRTFPRNKRKKIWVAGEMSWGDEPDGYGYQTMKRADLAGLHEIFGLE